MLLVLSPSKTLDYETPYKLADYTQPEFLADSEKLVGVLRKMSQPQIAKMMEISDKLAALNVARFKEFKTPFTPKNARQALLAFKGDVYDGIEVEKYKHADFAYAQEHVRILSGLYGLLRPLDLMQAYRLEMGRKITVGKTKDLYGFWGSRIATALNNACKTHKNKLILNLASEEYAASIDRKTLKLPMVDIVFKERQGDKLKIIGLFAKKARGLMAHYIVKERIDNLAEIKDFCASGYIFQPKLSDEKTLIFVRKAS